MYKKINIFLNTKNRLDKLVITERTSLAQFIEDAVTFFEKTGISPRQELESSKKALAQIERLIKSRFDRIIAFIQEQEKRYLLPMFDNSVQILDILAEGQIKQTKPVTVSGTGAPDITEQRETGIATKKDEQIFHLEKENSLLKTTLSEVVGKIEEKINHLHNKHYELHITEAEFNELKTYLLG